ncbi:unnamed protein product [Bursaphelenchus okinawaensis]|uniref:Very long-chain fatty acid transport protein n=1 Tax=Bursaphelenchus okinawaensis TaxID=465554 RepID=A0A811LNI5_9BILA|nr:unnamed protein product [Bursaphelenchus okinawaensis]CAG9126078.1 unnamed protein product [Bursaphelenchus okinawaensis]
MKSPKGLPNLGNTCFFNSVTQCILQTQTLEYYIEEVQQINKLVVPKNCVVSIHEVKVDVKAVTIPLPEIPTPFINAFSNFLAEFRCGRSPNPLIVFNEVSRKVPRFRGWHQQDSHELLRYLLDGLRSEEIERFKQGIDEYYEKHPFITNDLNLYKKAVLKFAGVPLLDSVFGGTLLQTIKCSECKHVSSIFEMFLDLSLPIFRDDCNQKKDKSKLSKHQKKKEQKAKRKVRESKKLQSEEAAEEDSAECCSKAEDEEQNNDSDEENENGNEVLNDEKENCNGLEQLRLDDSTNDCLTVLLEENGNDHCTGVLLALKRYFDVDVLSEADAYECENCCANFNKKVNKGKRKTVISDKRYLIFSPPPILTLHLKRFEQTHTFNRTTSSKIGGHIEFPMVLNLAPYCVKSKERVIPDQKRILYSLYGVVCHSGNLSSGHYIAYVRARKELPFLKNFFLQAKENFSDAARLGDLVSYLNLKKELTETPILTPSEFEAEETIKLLDSTSRWFYCSDSNVTVASAQQVRSCEAARWKCVKTAVLINCGCERKMGVSSQLVDLAIILVLCVIFFQYGNWFSITVICLLFRYFSSDIGKRGLKTLPRDLKGLGLLFRVKWTMYQGFKRNKPLHYYFLDKVDEHPNKECVVEVESGRTFTFKELNELSNKYANAYQKLSSENNVALFLENSADFFAIWLGLSKIGVVTAWINSNLKAEPLAHSIKVANTNIVVTSNSLLPTLLSTIDKGLLPKDLVIYTINKPEKNGNSKSLQDLLKNSKEPEANTDLNFQSVLCYIYTSGTTGNPKPAIIKHFRYFFIAMGSGKSFGVRPDDRIYITMPMYHSAAGILGIGQVLVLGATAVIRKKFSARNFWIDAKEHKCTASQYIGEICRYLLAQPKATVERQHNIRLMYGNGLRPEIWKEFVSRFGIKKIGELYGSTEGNSNIVNINNHMGSCGFFPIYPFLTALYPVRLVKVDPETGELIRDENGLCVSCRPGDTGEMVGMIKKNDPLLRFEGYVNKEDTDKKVIRDVTKKGDAVFSSGDILYWDKYGYLYFKDRRGDTYRWRGENVSTMEVEGVLQPIMQIQNATVFGVEVQGREGRAGMIGTTLNANVDVEKFIEEAASRLKENLAAYAIPVFLRICKEVETTGTFKLKKTNLQKDGFDPEKCGNDPLFYYDYSAGTYKALDRLMYDKIQSGAYSNI